jgi:putative Ca2+/H+ antiporter (TMEM165/GDT1 family)
MDLKVMFTVFISVFLAELGDKTQLATMLFASDKEISKWTVFVGAALALVVAAGIGVLVGETLTKYINPKQLQYISGIGFILIGAWTLYKVVTSN